MEEDLSLENLEKMEEVEVEIDRGAFDVEQADCPKCKVKMMKIVDDKDLFDGAMAIHIIKFKCGQCKKEYLDLHQAEKYNLYLKLSKVSQERPMEFLSHCLANGKVPA